MNYIEEYYKSIQINSFEDMLKRYYRDYYILFLTSTFKDNFTGLHQLTFIKPLTKLYFHLQHATGPKHQRNLNAIKILCIRETSPASVKKQRRHEDHFHCFLLIPKACASAFCKNAIESHSVEYYAMIDRVVPKLNLFPSIYKFEKKLDEDGKPLPEIADVDVRCLIKLEDVSRAYRYATKQILETRCKFNLDELAAYEKGAVRKKQSVCLKDEKDLFYLFGHAIDPRKSD